MTHAPNTPANMPTSPDTARSFARITRPILTIGGKRQKTEAEIVKAANRESKIQAGEFATLPSTTRTANPRNPGPYGGKPQRAPTLRAQFALVPTASKGTKTHG